MTDEIDDTKPFPIQGTLRSGGGLKPSTISWWLAEIAYAEYKRRYGGQQSIERMAERGGFGRQELLDLLRDKFHKEN
jgi:hypothetical protein